MSQLSFQGKKKQWKTKSLTWVFPFFAHLLDRSPLSQFLLTKQRMVKNSDNTEYPLAKKRGSHSSGSSPPPRILHSNNNAIRGFSIRYRQRMGGGKGWWREPSPPLGSGREERRQDSFPPKKWSLAFLPFSRLRSFDPPEGEMQAYFPKSGLVIEPNAILWQKRKGVLILRA